MSEETEREILQTLREIRQTMREIRDGQQQVIAHLAVQQNQTEVQVQKSRSTIDESLALQREALKRQRSIALVAIPAIFVCLAAIGYLLLRYF